MKKMLFAFLTIVMLIQFVPFYQMYVYSEIENLMYKEASSVEIQELGEIAKPEDFEKAVKKYTSEHNVAVLCFSYPYSENAKKPEVDVFLCAESNPDMLEKYINKQQFEEIKNSTKKLSARNGDYKLFSQRTDYRIQSFKNLEGKSLAREYFVYPKSNRAEFQKYLGENYGVSFNNDSQEPSKNFYNYENYIALNSVLIITLFIFVGFWVVGEYQLNATKGLLGYSNLHCVGKMIIDFISMLLGSFVSSSIIMAIYLMFYNKLSQAMVLYSVMFKHFGICFLVISFVAIISIILFYSSDVKYALKGKKPYIQLAFCSVALKIVMIVFICMSITMAKTAVDQNNQFKPQQDKWVQVNDYRFVTMYFPISDYEYERQVDLRCREFITKTYGIMIDNNNFKVSEDDKKDKYYQKYLKEHPYISKMIYINNEYLKINPIFDCDGNKVDIDEKAIKSDEIVVLVPEKYKDKEKEVYNDIFDWYDSSLYAGEDLQVREKKDKGEIPPVTVTIKFVKDNQTYFGYKFYSDEQKYNNIKDPIATIVTGENFGADVCCQFLTSNSYMLEVSDRQTMEDINKIASEIGIDKELSNLPTAYSCIDEQVKKNQTNFAKAMMSLTLSIVGIFAVSVYLTKNYIDESKKILFLKKMLGYPLSKIFTPYLASIFAIDSLVFLTVSLATKINYLIPAIIMILVDLLIIMVFIRTYQLSLNKSVLKGN